MLPKNLRNHLVFLILKHLESQLFKDFEYTFELAWKVMSSILKDQGVEQFGIKNILRRAAQLGLIQNIDLWFEFAHARNLTSHLYKEEIAYDVYIVAKGSFLNEIVLLLEKVKREAQTN